MSPRRTGCMAITWACLAMGANYSIAASLPTTRINVVAINDLHGYLEASPQRYRNTGDALDDRPYGGVAALGALLDELRAEDPDLLFIGAGDLIGASPAISSLWADEPVLEALNKMGMITSAAGNHEFDAGKVELLRQVNGGCESPRPDKACKLRGDYTGSGFPYIAANLIDTDTGKRLLPAYHIAHAKGVKIAFVGAVLKEMSTVVTKSGFAGLKVIDEADAINSLLPELQAQGVNAIVAVIHQGGHTQEPFDQRNCKQLEGRIVDVAKRLEGAVDALVSGHTHQGYQCSVGELTVTQAGEYGQFLTQLTLDVTPGTHEVTGISTRNLIVDPERLKPNDGLVALVSELRERTQSRLSERVGQLALPALTRVHNAAGESTLGNLITDAQLARTAEQGAQIAFANPGGLRADLHQPKGGFLTFEQLYAVQPFSNTLVLQDLTGAQLVALLNQQWSLGTFLPLQVSTGFYYEWDPGAPEQNRVVPGSLRLNGQPVVPENHYRVVANSFLAYGGNGFKVFETAARQEDTGILDLDALTQYTRLQDERGIAVGGQQAPRIGLVN
ncbi:bifunctional metallophosphatase/5'-nucleotidase [Pantoea sp. Ap-967]|uniref:bifunctional metallophosphatase/5'-nucleotidase n=1 Tax=Pantoea sp. Ap-967 TaxID=2608362 RepID=UPI00142271E6|nr:bifunctional metallophosphatase/5'-nucleotidase [Pantoea sp. Ap-967]NIE75037.1 bifunctional metallophosphatase/5'-nucleotidase [Pantoea sp. Ap-967]